MKKADNSKFNAQAIILWSLVTIVTILTIVAQKYLDVSAPIKAMFWIVWLILVLVLGYFTSQGRELLHFIKESKIELQKVVWPTRQETIQVTSIVMIMVALTSFILWGVDSLMIWAIAKLTSLG